MTEIELILILAILALGAVIAHLLREINRLDNNSIILQEKIENLDNWAEELDKWINDGGDQYLGLDFDLDMFKAETEEKIREEIKKEFKGE